MVDPTRIATVGHRIGGWPLRTASRLHTDRTYYEAVRSLTDEEIARFPRHIAPGLRALRARAMDFDFEPTAHFVMAHNLPWSA